MPCHCQISAEAAGLSGTGSLKPVNRWHRKTMTDSGMVACSASGLTSCDQA